MDDPKGYVQNHLESDTYSAFVDLEEIHDNCEYYSETTNLHLNQGFSILHINARSLKNKMDSFLTLLARSGVEWSAVCVSETWFKSDSLSSFAIDNYDLFASCREDTAGGGTAVYVHRKFNAKVRKDLKSLNNENTFVEVQLKHRNNVKNMVIGAIYRSPNSSHACFREIMENVMQKISEERKLGVLSGDFNCNLLKEQEDKNVQSFCYLMSSYGYINVISKPTRVTREHSSLLDNIFINNEIFVKRSGIIIDDLSDNFPVFVNLSVSNEQESKSLPKKYLT